MSAIDLATPVTRFDQLVTYLEAGCTPKEQWRIGTEHEKFGFRKRDLTPIPYEGEAGIGRLLNSMADRYGWQRVEEDGHVIALIKDGASVTLEPGGQLELSGAPLQTIHETQDEINEHLHQLGELCQDMDMAFFGLGVQPKWRFDDIPWMPKGRYRIMRDYLPSRGHLSLDMMARTCTVQANFDFSSEADMVNKFRLSMALQPLTMALFANSPFLEGKPNGFLSYRGEIWRHTDPDRCGWLPFVFEEGFGFARYAEYALDCPMLFLYEKGVYGSGGGVPFRAFMEGKHPAKPGVYPTLGDWQTHLSTLFPDVRLKHYLELRGADAGNSSSLCAMPALWKGLLHDETALLAAWDRVKRWSHEERDRIHQETPRLALQTLTPEGISFRALGLSVLEIARASLHRQGERNANGCDESIFLDPLFITVENNQTPAERLLEAYKGRWRGAVEPLFWEEEFESFYAECTKKA
ncbi:glutamate--cysteine ligase [Magnetococcus marinus MC-1]|uniref:Glutamate--cysteine ligase n=1 Tax=Magnetococcus marinus (strain ATCC BAA-1437 / JCM 17883 / MC-1) TaxID=156889 RepID=A0LDX1_MAGMM|nr:glutamate--cysteine ligase [Magnetococcus marinus]ABK46164.1 glutamate--cysteine ligase [Magnetococcus marinus MC-1]